MFAHADLHLPLCRTVARKPWLGSWDTQPIAFNLKDAAEASGSHLMLGEAMADFELLEVGASLQSSFYDSFLPAIHQVSLVALCAKRVGLPLWGS